MNHYYRTLLKKSLIALVIGAILVTLCYFLVDRPVAYYVHDHRLSSDILLKWLTYPEPIMQSWVPVVLVLLMIRRAFGPLRRWEWALFAAGVGMVIADQFRESLSYVFARYWPETWRDNNPSLIGNGVFGFNFFHEGSAYGSFPSGHASRTLAVGAVIWITWPRWRWAVILISFCLCVALVLMNYHFVSDVIAGTFIGSIVGTYAARLSGIDYGIPSMVPVTSTTTTE
ncbi:MAG TPA: phosphatase PAP2 family protein [Gemmatales bacterium]|nr:phosphatase PAP2 family protein [Gemmatales bacterium]